MAQTLRQVIPQRICGSTHKGGDSESVGGRIFKTFDRLHRADSRPGRELGRVLPVGGEFVNVSQVAAFRTVFIELAGIITSDPYVICSS